MKSFLKILLIVLFVISVLIFVLPVAFKGKITNIVRQQINKEVNADVDFKDVSISLIKDFPNLSFSVNNITVVGKEDYDGDTLATLDNFSIVVDIMSAFSDTVEVKSVILNKFYVNIIASGGADQKRDSPKTTTKTEEKNSNLSLKLNLFSVTEGTIIYNDKTSGLKAVVNDLNLNLTGNFSGNASTLKLKSEISSLNVSENNISYIKNAKLAFKASIMSDFDKMMFTFLDNELALNGLTLGIDGSIRLLEEKSTVDITVSSKQSEIKTLLALVPEVYRKDYDNLETSGSFSLLMKINGDYVNSEHIPPFNMSLNVKNGKLKYPDLPKSVDDINIYCTLKNKGGTLDNTSVNISRLQFSVGNNPFVAKLKITNPVSNPVFNVEANGKIDLSTLKEALPVNDKSIKGVIDIDIAVDGNYAMIENEDYENLKSTGNITITNLFYSNKRFPEGIYIQSANLVFTPQFMKLNTFKSKIGKSDFNLSGNIENYLAYALKNGILKGVLDFRSHFIDANELLNTDENSDNGNEEKTGDDQNLQPVQEDVKQKITEVPKDIDFTLNTSVDEVLYDKLVIKNIKGRITLRNGKAILNGLKMNLLDGKATLSGDYNTNNPKKPSVNFNVKVSSININKAANTIESIDSIMPIAKYSYGKVSAGFEYSGVVNGDFSPVLPSVDAKGNFKASGISVKDSPFQQKLALLLNDDKYRETKTKKLNVKFNIKNGEILIKPFNVNIFGKNVKISGKQGLDKTMNYIITWPFTGQEIGALVKLKGVKIPVLKNDIPVVIKLTGKFNNPSLSIDTDSVKKALLKEIGNSTEKTIDKILKDKNLKEGFDNLKKQFGGGKFKE
jgi:uncharacterized protein involved in outer membrane biogenesis